MPDDPCSWRGRVARTSSGWGVVVADITDRGIVRVHIHESAVTARQKHAVDGAIRISQGPPEQLIDIPKSDVIACSVAPIGCCVDTICGLGVLVGYRQCDGAHIVRLPYCSATAYLQRGAIVGVSRTCPDLPVKTEGWGVGTCIRYCKEWRTWTVRLASGGFAYLPEELLACDARFVPLVETGKRRWRNKQSKTFAILQKLHRLAMESGVFETLQETVRETDVDAVYSTARKAIGTTVQVVEAEWKKMPEKVSSVTKAAGVSPLAVLRELEGDEECIGHESGDAGPGADTSAERFATPPASETEDVDEQGKADGVADDADFRDFTSVEEHANRIRNMANEGALAVQKTIERELENKFEDEKEVLHEVRQAAEHLQNQGAKVVDTVSTFGRRAATELQEDEQVREAVDSLENAAKAAHEAAVTELEKVSVTYEKSKMGGLLKESQRRLQSKFDKIGKSTQGIEQQGIALTEKLNQGLHDFVGTIGDRVDILQVKGAAIFGTVQKRYLAGPNGWIAKTRRKIQEVLKDDQLGLRQWDFATYTTRFETLQSQAAQAGDQMVDGAIEVFDSAAVSGRERGQMAKHAVNSAVEQLVSLAHPDESAMELLLKLESMRGAVIGPYFHCVYY